jgi:HK97 family phage major capsid protein
MTKNELLAAVAKLRNKCENEGRTPNKFEREEAQKMLAEIDQIDHEDFFYRSNGLSNTIPSEGNISRSRNEKPIFKNLGEQLLAVKESATPGRATDNRLYKVAERRAATGLGESVPSDGGFLVETQFVNSLLEPVWSESEILKRITKYSLTGNSNGIKVPGLDETSRADGSRAGGVRAYWKAEAALKTASKPAFRQISLSLNKLIGLCYSSDEALQDSSILGQFIKKAFADEISFRLQDAIIHGTGAGMPLGIANSGSLVSVSKETGQAADTVVYENVLKMWSRLFSSSRKNAVWIINQSVEPQLYQMSLAVGTGGAPVYLPMGGASAAPYSTLFGRPVIPIEQCSVCGDLLDIALCDWQRGYVSIDKGGLQSDVSIHVQFIYDESVNAADDYSQLKKAA